MTASRDVDRDAAARLRPDGREQIAWDPTALVECVPNFSEGRRPEVIAELVAAVEGMDGVALLDTTSDVDHHRSVLTFAGPPDAVAAAMERAMAVAVDRIDLRRHTGQHPRLGAVDVIPFVPLGETPMETCVALARRFATEAAARFQLPIYLYGAAATRAERRLLSDIRKPQFEGLAAMLQTPAGRPDAGPMRAHPSAGATVVGARPFLIAYNIDLASQDLAAARRIAAAIRERGGGLPAVQALGLELAQQGRVQVSLNLLDLRRTGLWEVWEAVHRLAAQEGVEVLDAELIGLIPTEALTTVADRLGVSSQEPEPERVLQAARWLRIREFEPRRVLEWRLAEALERGSDVEAGSSPASEQGSASRPRRG